MRRSEIAARTDYRQRLLQLTAAVCSGTGGFEAYRTNVYGARISALADIYPVTRVLLGEAGFGPLTRAYALHYPSRHWNINLYGEEFASLLQAQQGNSGAPRFNWPELAEVATIEFALNNAYYAAGASWLAPRAVSCRYLESSSLTSLRAGHGQVIWSREQPQTTTHCRLRVWRSHWRVHARVGWWSGEE